MGILEQFIETTSALSDEFRAMYAEMKVYALATQSVHLSPNTGCTIRYSDWYSVDEVARYLGFKPRYVRQIPELELPSRKIGTNIRYRGIDVLRYDGTLSNAEYAELKQHLNPLVAIKNAERHSQHTASMPNRFRDLQAETRKKTGS